MQYTAVPLERRNGLDGFQLKLIALIIMTIDHIYYFGCSLTEYVNTLRCRHACQLLLEKHDATITDISLACGFDSIND